MRTTSVRITILHVLIAINLMMSLTLTRGTVRVSAQTGCPASVGTGNRMQSTVLVPYGKSDFPGIRKI